MTHTKQYRVYFNNDCMQYGIQTLVPNLDYVGDKPRWLQILITPNGQEFKHGMGVNIRNTKCYTHYKGVAERWLKQLQATA